MPLRKKSPAGSLQKNEENQNRDRDQETENNPPVGGKLCKKKVTTGTPRSNQDQKETTDRKDDMKVYPSDENGAGNIIRDPEPKVYKDNAFNRRLGRVGKPLGTAVHSRKAKTISEKTYKDNALNRKLGRVGLPLGSMPVHQKTSVTRYIPKILEKLNNDELENFTVDFQCTMSQIDNEENDVIKSGDTKAEAFEQAVCQYNRREAEMSWQRQSKTVETKPKTLQTVLDDYEGQIIPFSDLTLHKRIGQGGFGEVFFAKWRETVVAVKKLRAAGKPFDKGLQSFAKEIINFCKLDHPSIVKFIGACTDMPNICIVMEYMQMSLHEAIHLHNEIDFSETERTSIVKQTCEGVKYLHASRIAHCDLKTRNVLLDYVEGHICNVKITDFGLSMVIANTIRSGSAEKVRNAGTPRYSAPELLRGEMIAAKDMMKADIYSLALVILEVVFEQEPFATYNLQQLRERVGEGGEGPEIRSNAPIINQKAMDIIERAWSFQPADRPDIGDICAVFRQMRDIYSEEEMIPTITESLSNLNI